AGGLDRMLDVEGGAQQDRFLAGTQQIAVRMAAELGDRVVLDAPVRVITRNIDHTLTVTSDGGTFTAGTVVVAVPPEHRGAIEFA
ncbi:monooxygenase, partial [Mycobacterium sp. ITM-2017-0098]